MRPGDHRAVAFSDEAELEPVLAPYVSEGLAGGDRVLYLTDVTHPAVAIGLLRGWGVDTGCHVAARRLDVRRIEVYDADTMLGDLTEAARLARADGYRALRVTAEMSWGLREGADRLADFESRVHGLFSTGTALGLCQYDRRLFPPVVLSDLYRIHQEPDSDLEFDGALLRIRRTVEPAGIRVEGDVEASTLEPLTRSLRAAASRGRGDVHVDLGGVSFIDLSGLRALLETAGSLGSRRSLVLERVPDHVRELILLIGWDGTPGLRLGGSDRR
ncbi:MEDS domain-containing protein [Microbispora corallina]|uniref:MEDS domain-containing protein n=1 Tax=Microbispora corallina TaxID=83302 RepID=UPI001EF29B01|nr:MEDS domain-containing protein [Microbispora corallina]